MLMPRRGTVADLGRVVSLQRKRKKKDLVLGNTAFYAPGQGDKYEKYENTIAARIR